MAIYYSSGNMSNNLKNLDPLSSYIVSMMPLLDSVNSGTACAKRSSDKPKDANSSRTSIEASTTRLCNDGPRNVDHSLATSNFPVDMLSREGEYLIVCEMPGIEKTQVQLFVDADQTLNISILPQSQRPKPKPENIVKQRKVEDVEDSDDSSMVDVQELDVPLEKNDVSMAAAASGAADECFLLQERQEPQGTRRLALPKDAALDSIQPQLKDGLLSIRIAKKPKTGPVMIAIN